MEAEENLTECQHFCTVNVVKEKGDLEVLVEGILPNKGLVLTAPALSNFGIIARL